MNILYYVVHDAASILLLVNELYSHRAISFAGDLVCSWRIECVGGGVFCCHLFTLHLLFHSWCWRLFQHVVDVSSNPISSSLFNSFPSFPHQGLVGAPACGDVMKVRDRFFYAPWSNTLRIHSNIPISDSVDVSHIPFFHAPRTQLQIKVDKDGNIQESKFKTFGCGSAIASSSVATEWVKGKHVDEVLSIKNTDIAAHLKLPPVKLHCSMLAEDAIRAAVNDWKAKRDAKAEQVAWEAWCFEWYRKPRRRSSLAFGTFRSFPPSSSRLLSL